MILGDIAETGMYRISGMSWVSGMSLGFRWIVPPPAAQYGFRGYWVFR